MKKKFDLPSVIFIGVVLVAAIVLGWHEAKPTFPRGTEAPLFVAQRLDGTRVVLSELKGKVVLVNFWATWCGYCVKEMPELLKVVEELKPRGVELIAVSLDDRSDQRAQVERFLGRMPQLSPYAVLGTPDIQAAYKVHPLPTTFVIDRNGKIFTSSEGQASESAFRDWLEDALEVP